MWPTFALLASLLSLEAPVPVNGRCPDGRAWTTSSAEQSHMLDLLNQVRGERRRPRLARVAVLDRMAMAHAADMACRNYFDHRNREREKLQDRYRRIAGRDAREWNRLAEILGTSTTALRQVEQWLDSRSHRNALLERRHDGAGIGLVRIRGSRYATYWAVEFVGN
ncbi:MAG: CAP domain-containing protein [Vicinamibacterales bacterium]